MKSFKQWVEAVATIGDIGAPPIGSGGEGMPEGGDWMPHWGEITDIIRKDLPETGKLMIPQMVQNAQDTGPRIKAQRYAMSRGNQQENFAEIVFEWPIDQTEEHKEAFKHAVREALVSRESSLPAFMLSKGLSAADALDGGMINHVMSLLLHPRYLPNYFDKMQLGGQNDTELKSLASDLIIDASQFSKEDRVQNMARRQARATGDLKQEKNWQLWLGRGHTNALFRAAAIFKIGQGTALPEKTKTYYHIPAREGGSKPHGDVYINKKNTQKTSFEEIYKDLAEIAADILKADINHYL